MENRKVLLVVLIIVVGVLLADLTLLSFTGDDRKTGDVNPLNLEGYSKAEVSTGDGGFFLASGCRKISMVTTEGQLVSISRGEKGEIGFRPLTHDLMVDLMEGFNLEARMVKIDRMKSGVYFARLVVEQGERVLSLDSRPSDAVAVAVRTGIPVFVRGELLTNYGKVIC